MANEAGIYTHLWRLEELKIEIAKELIEPLKFLFQIRKILLLLLLPLFKANSNEKYKFQRF
jgi:hypothetical protein